MPMTSNDDFGFTLLEVLVAMGLGLVAISGVASLLTLAICAVRDSRDASVEAALAVQKSRSCRRLRGEAPALAVAPPGALDCDIPGYSERVDTRGVVVGSNGAERPAGVFIRRWRFAQ